MTDERDPSFEIDLDPDESDDIARVIERARDSGGYLHIEIRHNR